MHRPASPPAVLPFIGWPQTHGKAPHGTFWKKQYILQYAAWRPVVWIDDDITALDREFTDRHHMAAALLLRVDERIGLTRPDFDVLTVWTAAL